VQAHTEQSESLIYKRNGDDLKIAAYLHRQRLKMTQLGAVAWEGVCCSQHEAGLNFPLSRKGDSR
jgi:hypothetical protein